MSLIKRAFSGQADNILRQIRDIIRNNGDKDFPIDEIIDKLRGTNKSIVFTDDDIETLLDRQYGKGETLTVLMLLYPSLDFSNKFHVDHMYPKSKFTRKQLLSRGVPDDKVQDYIYHVNDISNLQLLAAIPNMEKQNEDFSIWFDANYPTEQDKIQYRMIHYLPNMAYTYQDFELFLSERRAMLKNALTTILC